MFADGAEAAAARRLNQPFRKLARTGHPHVVYKAAASLDGFTATPSGASKWIPGPRAAPGSTSGAPRPGPSRSGSPRRSPTTPCDREEWPRTDASPGRQPARVVFDSSARLPVGSKLVASIAEAPLYVIVSPAASPERTARLRGAGAELVEVGGEPAERVVAALAALGAREIDSVLLEGGPTLAGSFLDAGEIDEVRLFVAPLLLGSGRPLLAGTARAAVTEGVRALAFEFEPSGEDLLARARLREW